MSLLCLQSAFPWYGLGSSCFCLINQATQSGDNWRQQKQGFKWLESESDCFARILAKVRTWFLAKEKVCQILPLWFSMAFLLSEFTSTNILVFTWTQIYPGLAKSMKLVSKQTGNLHCYALLNIWNIQSLCQVHTRIWTCNILSFLDSASSCSFESNPVQSCKTLHWDFTLYKSSKACKQAIPGPQVNYDYLRAFHARASCVNDARICGTNFWRDLTRISRLSSLKKCLLCPLCPRGLHPLCQGVGNVYFS